MGEEYVELPLYGRAGTCCFYDIACYHTRLDGDGAPLLDTLICAAPSSVLRRGAVYSATVGAAGPR